MNNFDINNFVDELIANSHYKFKMAHKLPCVEGSSHALEIDSESCIGTISIWSSGLIEWHVFDVESSVEIFIGSSHAKNTSELELLVEGLFKKISENDLAL